MNPVALIHVAVGLLAIGSALPLVGRKVRMNCWYGIRIPQAFESNERWFEINAYGGRLLLVWGGVIASTGLVGTKLGRKLWVPYDWGAAAVILLSLGLFVAGIYRHVRIPKA
jgi:hypothetical protein